MNVELLRTFLELAKTGHFGQTAERLHLTQSAVSLRIKQLEALVGTSLFTRDKHSVVINAAGERLRQHAEFILSSWQLALQDITAIQEGQRLKVGCTANLWTVLLQAEWLRWKALLPGLDLSLRLASPQWLAQALQGGQLDLIVSPDLLADASIDRFKYRDIELCLFSRKTIRQFSELDAQEAVFVDWGSDCNAQQRRLFQAAPACFYTDQGQLAFDFLLHHGGFAFLPSAWSKKGRRVCPVPGVDVLIHPVYIHHRVPQSPSIIQAIEYLRVQLPKSRS